MTYKASNFHGHTWAFPGGAESSYRRVVRKIQNNPRLSRKQKEDFIDEIQYLCGHIVSDAVGQINQGYSSAHSAGIDHMRWCFPDDQPGWFVKTFFRDVMRRLRMNLHLSDQRCVYNVRERIEKTAKKLSND